MSSGGESEVVSQGAGSPSSPPGGPVKLPPATGSPLTATPTPAPAGTDTHTADNSRQGEVERVYFWCVF